MPNSGAVLEFTAAGETASNVSKQLNPPLRPVLILRFGAGWKRWQKVGGIGGSNLYKSKVEKPPSYLPTHRREKEKIVKLPLSP